MKKSLIILAAMVASLANAQGFVDEPTCYTWEGGHKSAGSFTKCPGPWVMPKKAAPPPPPAPVVAAPVMQNVVCPPQVILEPEPVKKRRHYKPRPRPVCKP